MIIATQTSQEGGSLQNFAEHHAEQIWQHLCPEETEPPLFIAHLLIGNDPFGPQQYRFTAAGPYKVERPVQWGPILDNAELQELVGGPVDL